MPRTPPYLAAPPAREWPLTHATTILPDPRESRPDPPWTEAEIEWARMFWGGNTPAEAPTEAPTDPDPTQCTGPRADTCTQAPTGPCLPRVCPGCLSSDTAEAYHHHCHGKAAATPSTCAPAEATEAAQTCQAQTDPR